MSPGKICPQCGAQYPDSARFCEIDGTALRSAGGAADLVGSVVADRYHVLQKLGEGGMGQVYLAEHVKMGRKSALKVMHPGMVKDIDAISRFNREAANASRISHANVAAIYDFGETPDGIIYLAMEFVDGAPLTKLIEQAGSLPLPRAAEIVRQTSEALSAAHDIGIVHRDLKPDNIMVATTRDGADLVKVVDFGIAKAANSEAQKVTRTGLVVGTPEYMSPEQLAGDQVDGRSDIYALGLVAFNMLTGTLPFPAASTQESMIMRLTDRPRTLAEMRPDVAWPPDVQTVMDRALARDAAERYQTAAEMGRDFVRAIQGIPGGAPALAPAPAVADKVELPPTRVGPHAPAANGANQPARPRRRLLVPAIAGVMVGVVAAAVYLGMKSGATDGSSPLPVPTQAGVQADSSGSAGMQSGSAAVDSTSNGERSTPPPANAATEQHESPSTPNRPTRSTEPPARQNTAADRPIDFDHLDRLANEKGTASQALSILAASHLRTGEDSVRAALTTFTARLSLERQDACDPLRAVADIAPRTTKADLVARKLRDLCPE